MTDFDERLPLTIPIAEETASIAIREVVTGGVRITTRTETAEETLAAALASATAQVTRVPINRQLEAGAPLPQTRTEGGVTIVPVFEEVMVVETRILLKEEVRIELQTTVENVSIPVSVRRQRAEVERMAPSTSPRPISQTTDQE